MTWAKSIGFNDVLSKTGKTNVQAVLDDLAARIAELEKENASMAAYITLDFREPENAVALPGL